MTLLAVIGLASLTSLTAIGFAVYSLRLKSQLNDAYTATDTAIGKMHLAEARLAAEITKLANKEAENKRLRGQLAAALLDKGALYERLAKAGVIGAAGAVDDLIAGLYAQDDSHRETDSGIAGPMPDRSPAVTAETEADLVSGDRPARPPAGDLS